MQSYNSSLKHCTQNNHSIRKKHNWWTLTITSKIINHFKVSQNNLKLIKVFLTAFLENVSAPNITKTHTTPHTAKYYEILMQYTKVLSKSTFTFLNLDTMKF